MSRDNTPKPIPADIVSALDYDPKTGILRWQQDYANKRIAGQVAGYVKKASGRRLLKYKEHDYLVARVIWVIMTGKNPEHTVDHKDRDPLNDRWENLRDATKLQQSANKAPLQDKHAKGVWRVKRRWYSSITHNWKVHNLGAFDTEAEAAAAYFAKAKEFSGEFAYPNQRRITYDPTPPPTRRVS